MTNIWDPEYTITKELASQLIEEQFPISVDSIEEIGEGFDNTIFRVNKCYTFRFPRREIAVKLLKSEWELLRIIADQLPVPVPKPIFLGTESHAFPRIFIGYHYLAGKAPQELTNEERLKMIKPLAMFLKKLHSLTIDRFQTVPYDEFDRLHIDKRKSRLIDAIQKLQKYENLSLFDLAEDYAKNVTHNTVPNVTVLTHGDLHIRNMLVNEEKELAGMIDWGDTHIGHPAVDLSIAYSLFPSEGQKQFFSIYGEVDDTTLKLAQFKAIFTIVSLLTYSIDKKDNELYEEGKISLSLALLGE
ncbi:phosphotransferase [Niallia alba]|uniref:phosphotransferase n=1 Tax=Niallia alba TaxID=2729105 RepID=UPI002E1ADED9|nr:phosphotransferase [Niallia alba]